MNEDGMVPVTALFWKSLRVPRSVKRARRGGEGGSSSSLGAARLQKPAPIAMPPSTVNEWPVMYADDGSIAR